MSVSTARAISPDSGTHWTEPGAWQVAPGIHRIPLPLPMDGLRAVNVYAIETDSGLTLIDGGWAIEVSRKLLDQALASLGRSVRDIDRFLVTHVHRDHYTQAITVRSEVGSHVSLGLGDKPTIDLIFDDSVDEDPHIAMFEACGAHDLATMWGDFTRSATPDLSVWGYPDTWLDGDIEIPVGTRSLSAVHTPGHTQGHYVFADQPGGLLFAGDHVLPTITPSIGFEPKLAAQPLGDFLGSLTKVRGLPDLMLLPAHGPVAPSSHARVDELLAHHEQRLRQCRDALASGPRTAFEVAHDLGWTRHDTSFVELDVFNQALATLETRAHLELLVARGDVSSRDEAGRGGAAVRTYAEGSQKSAEGS